MTIYSTSYSVAFKNCNGKYDISELSLFKIENLNEQLKNVNVDFKNKEINIKVKCHLCEGYHIYKYNLKKLKTCKLIIGGCTTLGEAIFIIGKNNEVQSYVNKQETIIKKIYAML